MTKGSHDPPGAVEVRSVRCGVTWGGDDTSISLAVGPSTCVCACEVNRCIFRQDKKKEEEENILGHLNPTTYQRLETVDKGREGKILVDCFYPYLWLPWPGSLRGGG